MAGGIDWFRWHHGSVTDPKFGLIAKKAGARVGDVIAVWAALLEHGSANGASVASFDFEACDELFGFQRGCSRAIGTKLTERSFIVDGHIANTRRYFPSVSLRPSGGAWAAIRTLIFKRDNYTCRYCGCHGVRLECDHVVPVVDGGQHDESNLVTACFSCNRSKADHSLSDWEAVRGW